MTDGKIHGRKPILLSVDFAFQYVMRDVRIAGALIAAVLGIPKEEVKGVRLLPRDLNKIREEDKLGIVDILAETKGKERYNIELQMRRFPDWPERSLYYLFKMYVDQIKSGKPYGEVGACIGINILGFNLLEHRESYHTLIQFLNTENGAPYTHKIALHILELKKLDCAGAEERKTELYRWMRALKASNWTEYEALSKEDETMAAVKEKLEEISQDEILRLEYFHRELAVMDREAELEGARREGREGGIEEVAVELLRNGMEPELVCRYTKLSEKRIGELWARLEK
ncbi:Rpn family recombination-promoting nuclease/putative transposase [Anaerolentibacter hominis]|uniref:Rpn family recombination-promoting nuclease/putative transposase n=1 Tax=Anaerolentibacter hominis TaxID=3079009 RepID=UPI0031B884EB